MSLGKIGFQPGTWADEAMVLDAIKELYRLQGDVMTDAEAKHYKKEIGQYTKYECLNKLRKLNRQIKNLGGNEIKRKGLKERLKEKLNAGIDK